MPPLPSSSPGAGRIVARLLPPSLLTLPVLSFQYPLKLIASTISPTQCLTVFILSYGGGLVSNDKINLSVSIEEGAKLCLLTQGSTKIFKRTSPEHLTTQTLTARLARNAALLLLPDPLQPFADSVYLQHQIFHLPSDDSASLIILDWYTEGRSARNEKWAFESFESRNDVYIDLPSPQSEGEQSNTPNQLPLRTSKLLLRDTQILTRDPSAALDELQSRMDFMSVFATLLVRGPRFEKLQSGLLRRYSEEPRIGARNWHGEKKEKIRRFEGVVWTAAKVRGFVAVKAGGRVLEDVRAFLRSCLEEEGEEEVIGEFGRGVVMCLQ
ncbi:UreD-domain-containing protein [Ascodesmis nigricans]|uniref:UreD-domain-containing protein n=1 Tax=Ascodesmis nigricans TaxID=341454 RepID=A0A4S2N633_9PEZI|nr:UreD-domain-containing protein [Ascodesmis nigricans]